MAAYQVRSYSVKLTFEKRLWEKSFNFVAGLDEAGRGPLAGPVVAAAVVFPQDIKLPGLADSKKLSPRIREKLYCQIMGKAVAVGIGSVGHGMIDRINILRANLLAMKKAIEDLPVMPDFILVDGGRYKLEVSIPQAAIAGGDGKCFSIAAASIIAKVTRDRIMLRYHQKYPAYRFDLHKGYGTRKHFRILKKIGPCPIHRKTFFPVKELI